MFNSLRDLVHVESEIRTDLGDDLSKERTCLVEIRIVRRVAVDAFQPEALEEFIAARSNRSAVD